MRFKFLKNALVGFALLAGIELNGADLAKMPADENPLILMFAINGKPENSYFGKYLKIFRNAGITQFMIYARSGCEFNYMQEDWCNIVKYMVDEAKRLKFSSVWLYDEFNWPSGTANKKVMQLNPEHALHQLSAYRDENGEIKFKVVKNPQMSNLLDADAVQSFINLTHEKYYSFLKEDFGGIIRGIFTDEPALSYFLNNPKYIKSIAYYDGIEQDYKKLTGNDLRSDIVSGITTNSAPYRAALSKLLAKRFRESYIDKITRWATNHNIYATGHLLNENAPSSSHLASGHILDVLPGLSFPAIDDINTHESMPNIEWLTYSSGEYAIDKNGRKGGMVELFALGPCDIDISRVRRNIWFSAMFGMNRYLLAISQSDLRTKISNSKNGNQSLTYWLSSFSPSQPWFEKIAVLGEDAKKAAKFALKEPDAKVSVEYPYEVKNIPAFIRMLANNQITWKLFKEGDKTDAPYPITFSGKGMRIGNSPQLDAPKIVKILKERLADRPVVINENGGLAKDIFIRSYKDGSVVVINFTKEKRNLHLVRNGKKEPITIYPEGVVALEKNEPAPFEKGEVLKTECDWKVELNKHTTIRPVFKESKTYTFELTSPMQLTFSVRNLGLVPEFEVDGKKLAADSLCTEIPVGFKPVFKQGSLKLEAGKHTITMTNAVADYAYLPLLIISGGFSYEGNVISPYKNDGKGLYGYIGKVSQTAHVEIPKDINSLAFDTNGLSAELFINGKSCGTKMWAPFEWNMPNDAKGAKVEVKLVRYTTLGRIFGLNPLDHDKMPKNWAKHFFIRLFPKNKTPVDPTSPMLLRK